MYGTVLKGGRVSVGETLRVDLPNRSAVAATAGSAAATAKRVLMRAVSVALPRGKR
ncbi:MAG: hypothetical protein NTY24_10030 [Mycobacterium sp.]|nr:hypothetical protein [Mycobacterium sp.]